ncbi:MAG: hypothetical protein KatS3mg099_103 [Candidatus Parcubacteria bacterium]|nr:MAG: hypothetical protein KatS3mg099_103 [Candidatus Parcubacteria bacterium]
MGLGAALTLIGAGVVLIVLGIGLERLRPRFALFSRGLAKADDFVLSAGRLLRGGSSRQAASVLLRFLYGTLRHATRKVEHALQALERELDKKLRSLAPPPSPRAHRGRLAQRILRAPRGKAGGEEK